MGTEIEFQVWKIVVSVKFVKLNNPLMGTETCGNHH